LAVQVNKETLAYKIELRTLQIKLMQLQQGVKKAGTSNLVFQG
jgi:hypothetical protein